MQNNALLAHIPQVIRKCYRYSVFITLILFLLNPLRAQERTQPIINATISGTVIDSITKEPLEGALVQLESVTHSVATDSRGNFKFVTGQKLPATLIISYLGYHEARVIVNNSPVDIALKPSFNELTDVVITGYGSQNKQLYTGSASQIKAQDLEEKPAQSFDQLLSGQAAGVNMVQSSGALNNTPTFRIRGINSITSSIYPLIIVDGVTVFTGSTGGAVGNNPLADINPSDIETIDVLKDASATAIYGSRAANGVIVITTKKGKKGSSKATYSGSVSFSTPYNLPELLNAADYVTIKNEARQNAGLEPGFALGQTADGNPIETNWYDIAYQTGISQNHNISVSGANNATSYYFAANFTEQNGIIKTNRFNRKGIRLNADHDLNELLTFGINANYSNSMNAGPNTGAIGPNSIASSSGTAVNSQYIGLQPLARLTYILPPNVSVYNPDGSYNINGANGNIGHGPNNPVVGVFNAYNLQTILDLDNNSSENNSLVGSVYAELNLLPNLKFKTLYGLNNLVVENLAFRNPLSGDGFPSNGSASNSTSRYTRSNWTNTLNYNTTLNDLHQFTVLGGHELIKTKIAGWGAVRSGMSDSFFTSYQGGWTNIVPSNNIQTENAILSYFSTLNYDYDRKYLLSFNYRRDGLSALAKGNKWGDFGGGSIGWNLSEESFFKNSPLSKTLNLVKIRSSYGIIGNSSLDDYASLSQYGALTYAGNPSLVFSQAGNPNLQWEQSKKLDFGLDLAFLNHRLNVVVDYYKNTIDGLILSAPQSSSQGIPGNAIIANVGSLYNEGIELAITANIIQKADFQWNANFNISTLKNKVTSLGEGGDIYPASLSTFGIQNVTRVGYSVGSIFAVPTAGVNPDNGNKIYINKDNEKVQYNSATKGFSYLDGTTAPRIDNYTDGRIQGPSLPTYYGGLNSDLNYKNFGLSVNITFSGGNKLYNGTRSTLSDQRYFNNGTFIKDRWTKPGDITDIPKLVWGDSFTSGFSSTNASNVEDGDYIKLRNIALSYQIPIRNSLLDKYISGARVYIQASNLLTITNYSGSDPEISINGNSINSGKDQNVPVNATVFTSGVSISF